MSSQTGLPPVLPPTTLSSPTLPPGAATLNRRGGLKIGLIVGSLVVLAGLGVVLGALWSRSNRGAVGELAVDGTEAPDFSPSEPPPAPDPRQIPGEDVAEEGVTVVPGEEPEPPPRESGPSAGELWSQAFRLKEEKKYHSLREVLDRLIAKDPDYGQANEWRQKVDGWVTSRESDVRGEADDLLDNLIEALQDRDRAAMAELWGTGEPPTDALLGRLWEQQGPRLRFRGRFQSFKVWDDRGEFVAVITLADRNGRKLREITWRGAMVDDQDGPRFTVPLR